jgi:hypothetical protein
MRGRGFAYATPEAAANDNWPQPPAKPTPREIATAVADVECKQEVKLPSVWLAVESAYQNMLIERNAATLQQVKIALTRSIARAHEVLTR